MGLQGGGWSTVACGLLAKPCDSCKASAAAVFCRVDSAFLCLTCDAKIHSSNKFATPHGRVWMCEVCEQAPAAVTCKADAAVLCVTCDADIHSANPLARRHDRVPVEPFFDSAESIIVKSTAASSAAALSFLVPNVDVLSNTKHANEDDDPSNWLIPNPICNSKLQMDAPDIMKSSTGEVFFPEINSLLEFDYPNTIQHNISGSGTDSVVPVQPDSLQQPSFNVNHTPADQNCFDLDFCRSKLSSSFTYPTQSLSQSVSSSSVDIGVVPDCNSMSDISYPFGRNVCHNVSDPGVPASSTTGSQSATATQLCGLDREARVMRYREKRKNRKFQKTIRYASRKAYAETRPRIKGRFAKRKETDIKRQGVDHIYGSRSAPKGFIRDSHYGVVPTF